MPVNRKFCTEVNLQKLCFLGSRKEGKETHDGMRPPHRPIARPLQVGSGPAACKRPSPRGSAGAEPGLHEASAQVCLCLSLCLLLSLSASGDT